MPRTARIDIPGVLSHVLVRGIERRPIFLDQTDLAFFIGRLDCLLQETQTDCLAWALMPNHAHLLLRPGAAGLSPLMRRLLTAHAVRFNLRHQRAGYLFQNRFKSIPCEEEGYLLVLVRYIHLNPLKAGLVQTLDELDRYPWTGHAALIGNKGALSGQAIREVLNLFAPEPRKARHLYREFLAEGGGTAENPDTLSKDGRNTEDLHPPQEGISPSSLVLGGESFLKQLQRADDQLRGRFGQKPPLEKILEEVSGHFAMDPGQICNQERGAKVVQARLELCRRAINESGHRASDVAQLLRVNSSSVSRMLIRLDRK